MVAKGIDKMEVFHPGTGDAPRMGADPGIPRCLNPEGYTVLERHRNLKARVEGSHCMWDPPQLQSTGRQVQKE